eukprot:c19411_g1_i2 orf=194-628(-)
MARVARSIARTALPRLNPSRIANPSPRSNAASFVPRAFGNGASPSFRLSLRPASRPLRLRGEIAFLESLLPYHSAVSNACFVSRLRSSKSKAEVKCMTSMADCQEIFISGLDSEYVMIFQKARLASLSMIFESSLDTSLGNFSI